MDEEEQFVNIDLNDDNICSVCKLETDTGTLSFCHVCFELSIEGMSGSTLLHSKSLRGHRDCFEKFHLIANQKLCHSRVSRSAYEGVKLALGQKLSRIVQYAQNRQAAPSSAGAKLLGLSQQGDRKLLPQSDAQLPRYGPRWSQGGGANTDDTPTTAAITATGPSGSPGYASEDVELLDVTQGCLWGGGAGGRSLHQRHAPSGGEQTQRGPRGRSRDELVKMSVEELHQLNGQLLLQIQKVFEELTAAVQEKDSLSSELHVRHIAIEQLFKNCAKLPWLQIPRTGLKASSNTPLE